MVRMFNGNMLNRCLSEEMQHKLDSLAIDHCRKQCGESIIEMQKGQIKKE